MGRVAGCDVVHASRDDRSEIRSTQSSPRASSRRRAGYSAPGLGWYTLAGEASNSLLSP